jgi:hypothetical protein
MDWESVTFCDRANFFQETFCVETESTEITFLGAILDCSVSISEQIPDLRRFLVSLRLTVSDKAVSRLRHRLDILGELIQTEHTYVECLMKTITHFTWQFSRNLT